MDKKILSKLQKILEAVIPVLKKNKMTKDYVISILELIVVVLGIILAVG